MYSIGNYLRVTLPDNAVAIGKVHTLKPDGSVLVLQLLGRNRQLITDFEIVEQLSAVEVETWSHAGNLHRKPQSSS